jgi:hypothetical protein
MPLSPYAVHEPSLEAANAVEKHFSVRTIHSTMLATLLSLRYLRQPDVEPEVLPFYADRAVDR